MPKALARLLLLTAVTAVLIALAELAARALTPPPAPFLEPRTIYRAQGKRGPVGKWSLDAVMRKSTDPYLRELHGEFFPDVKFRICYDASTGDRRPYMDENGCVLVEINEDRLRGPRVPLDKPANTFRVAAIGDSFTFGDGVPWDITWPEGVRRLLGERLAAQPVTSADGETWQGCDTVNLGVPGYEVRDCEVYMRHRALDYEPDTIVYALFLNDILPEKSDTSQDIELAEAYRLANLPPTWLEERSYLWRMATKSRAQDQLASVLAHQYHDAIEPGSKTWKHVRQCVGRMKTGADARDIDYRIVIFPALVGLHDGYPYDAVHASLHSLFDIYEIPWIDMLDHYRGYRASDLWVHSTDHHPNEIALGLASEAIAEWIIDDVFEGEE